jgi:hypothetical protein
MAGNEVELLGGLFLDSVNTNEKKIYLALAENVHGCNLQEFRSEKKYIH